ncbi:MAG: hypothetical protein ACE3L7_00675 [Candidatus Pristimantibacillus sp.]
MEAYSILGALLFTVIAILTLLVTLGLPLGEFTLGGKYKVLPLKMRLMSGISLPIQIAAILIVLQVGELISLDIPQKIAKGVCIFFAIYLLINTAMNFLSNSKKEKVCMTPLAFISAICFFITAFTH